MLQTGSVESNVSRVAGSSRSHRILCPQGGAAGEADQGGLRRAASNSAGPEAAGR